MKRFARIIFLIVIACAPIAYGASDDQSARNPEGPQAAGAISFAAIPADKDDDIKFYLIDGQIVKGVEALGRMQREAGLVLWLAGNQFFAMDAVVRAFQAQNPAISVGLITLPPGLLLEAI